LKHNIKGKRGQGPRKGKQIKQKKMYMGLDKEIHYPNTLRGTQLPTGKKNTKSERKTSIAFPGKGIFNF